MIDRLMEEAGGRGLWKDAVTYLVPGKEEAWSGEPIDTREQAVDYSTQGRRKRDPYLLRQAALAYRSAGDEHEAGKCLALAAEFEGRLREAGDKYRELGLYDDAFRCYWSGRQWRPLCDLTAQESKLTSRLESRAADFMVSAGVLDPGFLAGLVIAAEDGGWLKEAGGDTTWREVVAEVADRLSKMRSDDVPINWVEANLALRRFTEAGVPIGKFHLAAIAYAAGDFEEAVKLWEQSGSTDRGEYNRAKARIAPFPEALVWFSRLKEHSEVLRQWRKYNLDALAVGDLDDRVIWAVADAALEEGDLSLVASMMQSRPDRERVAKLLAASVKARDTGSVNTAAVIAVRLFVQTRAWSAAIRAVDTADFSELPGISRGDIRGFSDITANTTRAVLQELAISEELPAETSERQTPIAEFLHRHFVGKRGPQVDDLGILPQVVGAAIERAGKIVDALQYYENLQREASTPEIERFAAERLAVNLERHADYFRGRGDDSQARQRELRAHQIRERTGIGARVLHRYPSVANRTPLTGPTEWLRGPFKIFLSRSHGRLRIEHTERFETVTLDARDGRLLGDAAFYLLDKSDSQTVLWQVEGWDTKITLLRGETTKCTIQFKKEVFEFLLI